MPARTRKIPQRTCIGCGEVKNKKELIRIVRTPEAEVLVDLTGKKSGRGAYICPNPDCLEQAVKGSKLAYKLNSEISADDKKRLSEELKKAISNE
ncbi:MAG TPA: YlxR family protein [Firmicutes bacterium]|nr:YlxR family protein [Bacillota bacterium]